MEISEIVSKLENAGLTTKVWEGRETRVYVKDRGRDLGYVTESDDGSTGTCKHLTRRAGHIAQILRR